VNPLIDRPGKETALSTAGCWRAISLIRRITVSVRSSEAASGSWAKATRYWFVLQRDKTGWCGAKHLERQHHQHAVTTRATIAHLSSPFTTLEYKFADQRKIRLNGRKNQPKRKIQYAGNPIFWGMSRPEQNRAQCRAERERVKGADDGRDRNGERELSIELAVRPLMNAVGTNTAQRTRAVAMIGPGDLLHCLIRPRSRGDRRDDVPFDIFNHDDCVIHHNPEAKTRPKQRERVDGESKRQTWQQTFRSTRPELPPVNH